MILIPQSRLSTESDVFWGGFHFQHTPLLPRKKSFWLISTLFLDELAPRSTSASVPSFPRQKGCFRLLAPNPQRVELQIWVTWAGQKLANKKIAIVEGEFDYVEDKGGFCVFAQPFFRAGFWLFVAGHQPRLFAHFPTAVGSYVFCGGFQCAWSWVLIDHMRNDYVLFTGCLHFKQNKKKEFLLGADNFFQMFFK